MPRKRPSPILPPEPRTPGEQMPVYLVWGGAVLGVAVVIWVLVG